MGDRLVQDGNRVARLADLIYKRYGDWQLQLGSLDLDCEENLRGDWLGLSWVCLTGRSHIDLAQSADRPG